MLPNVVIIGAQKAASTLLNECLRQHPQSAMPAGETHHFRDPYYNKETTADLEALFVGQRDALRRGIKCPDYLACPEVPARVVRDLDRPKILVVLRPPIERAVSAYYWWMLWGGLPIESLESGLPALMAGHRDAEFPDAYRVLDYGLYARHLTRWLDHVPPEDLLVLFDRDLRDKSAKALSSVYSFLGLEPDFLPRAAASVQNPGVYAPARLRWLNRRNKFCVTRDPGTGGLMLERPRTLGPAARNAAIVLTDRWLLSRLYRQARPTPSGQLLARLHEFYRDDTLRLQKMLGVDLSSWLSPARRLPGLEKEAGSSPTGGQAD